MARIIVANVNDGSAVSMDFEPEIDGVIKARLTIRDVVPDEVLAQVPHKLRIGPPRRGGVPDIIGWLSGPFIFSPRMRQLLDGLEPSVHKYIPLEIVSDKPIDGRTEHGVFYLLHSVPVFDAICIEKTDFNKGFGRPGYEAGKDGKGGGGISMTERDTCVVLSRLIQGRHLWRLPRVPGDGKYMCSEELWAKIEAAGFRGWDGKKRCSEE